MGILGASSRVRSHLGELWNRRPLWQRLLVVFIVSLAFLFGGILTGIAGDCAPSERDGQCGLSTFVGRLNGMAMGGIILVVGSVATIVQWYRAKRAAAE